MQINIFETLSISQITNEVSICLWFHISEMQPSVVLLSSLLFGSFHSSSLPVAEASRFLASLLFSFKGRATEHSLLLGHVRGLITLLLILDMHKIEG